MEFMDLLLVISWVILWIICTVGYFDLKHTIKEETISWVEKNDKIFRALRNFIEKEHPEILEKLKNTL